MVTRRCFLMPPIMLRGGASLDCCSATLLVSSYFFSSLIWLLLMDMCCRVAWATTYEGFSSEDGDYLFS